MQAWTWFFVTVSLSLGCAPAQNRGNQTADDQNVAEDSTPCFPTGNSDQHLVPPDEYADARYRSMVEVALGRSHRPDVLVRMTCLPSFAKEWATGLRQANTGAVAFVERAKESVYRVRNFELEHAGRIPQGGPRLEEITADYRETALDPETADLVARVWTIALKEVRAPYPGKMGLDGVSYELWQAGTPPLQGRTWSPKKRSRMAVLVRVAEALAALASADARTKDGRVRDLQMAATAFLELRPDVGARRPARRCFSPAPHSWPDAGP